MKILVSGHRGFVGSHILSCTHAVGLTDGDGQTADLKDASAVLAAIDYHHPDAVIHLAAQSFIPASFNAPEETYTTNFLGTHNLLTALKAVDFSGRFLFVSSADVYGSVKEEGLPLTEATPLSPQNPYAVSKVASEYLCQYWNAAEGMDIVIARPFNHIGPGQSPRFAIADFSRKIAEIKLGRRPALLEAGDLGVTRDFTDVRDIVDAYLRLLAAGERGQIYNICSGTERKLVDVVQDIARLAGVRLEIRVDPSRLRKTEHRRAYGSCDKLKAHTGWAPQIPWSTSLLDVLHYWEAVTNATVLPPAHT